MMNQEELIAMWNHLIAMRGTAEAMRAHAKAMRRTAEVMMDFLGPYVEGIMAPPEEESGECLHPAEMRKLLGMGGSMKFWCEGCDTEIDPERKEERKN